MQQKVWILAGITGIAAMIAGCGGGGGGANLQTPGSGTAYPFVAPAVGVTRTYAETIIDNSNNTIEIGFSDTATSVNADGSYSGHEQSTTGSSDTVNGTSYAVLDQDDEYDSSGRTLSYTVTSAGGALVTCTYDPHGSGPDFPVQVGMSWQSEFTLSCNDGSATITYTQQGSVVDLESVTVPAGTFTALKFQSTVRWTNAAGTARTQSVTNWRDTKTGYSVKQEIAITVSGTPPATGYAVSRTLELQSISPAS